MTQDLQAELFTQIEEPFTGELLFDYMTDLVFFIKNDRGQYVVVNTALVERCGCRQKRELIGRTPDQVYPPPLGQTYRMQDEELLRTGKPILNQLELQLYPSGSTGWCLTNKVPLYGRAHRVVGLVGISKDLHAPSESSEDYTPMAKTIQHIQSQFDQPLKISDLAAMAGLSQYQFEQRIHRIFELTAGQFIKKMRMDAAMRKLRDSDDPIVNIALDCGYSDQSTFTRQFKQVAGLSPAQYRRMIRE
jgi:PAS domain S-box-containing protein